MKLYILRHEERTNDTSFFSPLTKNGIINSINLIPLLDSINITTIISSPYIRTLQTIIPYSKKSNKKINLEYGLSEYLHPDIVFYKSANIELPDYLCSEFNYNSQYIPIVSNKELQYPEDEKLLELRIKKILKEIISKYYKTKENILLVTHQAICKIILELTSKNTEFKLNEDQLNNYGVGEVSLFFDENKWKYKKIEK